MILNRESKLITLLLLLSIVVSCQKETLKLKTITSTRNNQVATNNKKPTSGENKARCKSSQILDVLNDAQTIVSKLKKDPNKLVVWNANSLEVSHEISYPISYEQISPNGRYILRKVNNRKFYLTDFANIGETSNEVLTFNSVSTPKIQFSNDSNFLLVHYSPVKSNNNQQVLLYNLKEKKYVKSIKFKNVKHLSLTRDNRFFLVGIDNGKDKKIKKIKVEDAKEVYEIELNNYESFTRLEVGKQTIIVKTHKTFYFYDLESGQLNYDQNFKYFYDIGSLGENAIFVDDLNEFQVFELAASQVVHKIKNPELINLANCKLNDEMMKLVCKDYVSPAKISIWDLKTKKIEKVCY